MVESTTVMLGWTWTRVRCGWQLFVETSCWRSGRFLTTRMRSSGCYEGGRWCVAVTRRARPGSGLYRRLVERGIDCRVVAPGLARLVVGGVRTTLGPRAS